MPDIRLDLAYLAGLWDGEGCITVWHSIRKVSKRRTIGADRYTVSLILTNTNKPMIDNALRILKNIDIIPCLYYRKWEGLQKDTYQLTMRNMNDCEKVIKNLYPYLISKKPQAKLVLEFIGLRKKTFLSSKGWGHGTPYSEREIEISKLIQSMNKKGKQESSETTRQTLTLKISDDIVRTNGKPLEVSGKS